VFDVFDPNGAFVGQGKVGVLFNKGGLSFTLADGAADFVAGDGFTITVAANADAGKYTSGRSGRHRREPERGKAILGNSPFDVTSADTKQTVISRACEVNASELTYPAGATANQIAASTPSSRRPASSSAKGPPTVLNQPSHTRRHCGG
jgi:hypothetical protein